MIKPIIKKTKRFWPKLFQLKDRRRGVWLDNLLESDMSDGDLKFSNQAPFRKIMSILFLKMH